MNLNEHTHTKEEDLDENSTPSTTSPTLIPVNDFPIEELEIH